VRQFGNTFSIVVFGEYKHVLSNELVGMAAELATVFIKLFYLPLRP
jgi:hypothetical protein